jgi:hypothetical protein
MLIFVNSLHLLWEMTKQDVRTTLKNVCKRLLNDQSVSERTRNLRAQALIMLGNEYSATTADESKSLESLIDKIGKQSGLFGNEEPSFEKHFKHFAQSKSDDQHDRKTLNREFYLDLKSRIHELSVKELRQNVIMFGGDCSACIEKYELETALLELIDEKISELDRE